MSQKCRYALKSRLIERETRRRDFGGRFSEKDDDDNGGSRCVLDVAAVVHVSIAYDDRDESRDVSDDYIFLIVRERRNQKRARLCE